MTNQNKDVLQQAVDQISVPENEVRRALAAGLKAAPVTKKKRRGLWLELGVGLAAAASIFMLIHYNTVLSPAERTEPTSAKPTISSIERIPEVSEKELHANNWRTAEGTYYGFSDNQVFVKETNREGTFYDYRLTGESLQLFDSTGKLRYSYSVSKVDESLVLQSEEDNADKIVLQPIVVRHYTEADIASLEPAVNPELTIHEWVLESGASDWNVNIFVFDGTTLRNATEDLGAATPGFYTMQGNEIQISYNAMGGISASYYMYWDGETLVFWPSDENDHKEERQMIFEPKR